MACPPLFVSVRRSDPSGRTVQISPPRLRAKPVMPKWTQSSNAGAVSVWKWQTNAIVFPSGDQTGSTMWSSPWAIIRTWPPFRSPTQIALVSPSRQTKAIAGAAGSGEGTPTADGLAIGPPSLDGLVVTTTEGAAVRLGPGDVVEVDGEHAAAR